MVVESYLKSWSKRQTNHNVENYNLLWNCSADSSCQSEQLLRKHMPTHMTGILQNQKKRQVNKYIDWLSCFWIEPKFSQGIFYCSCHSKEMDMIVEFSHAWYTHGLSACVQ